MSRKKRRKSGKKSTLFSRAKISRRKSKTKFSARRKFFAIVRFLLDRMRITFMNLQRWLSSQDGAQRFAASLSTQSRSTQAREAGFLVARLHIEAGEVHGADDLVERDLVRLHSFRARRAACTALAAPMALRSMQGICTRPPMGSQVMPRLCSMAISAACSIWPSLPPRAARQSPGRHRAGHAHFALAPNLSAADGRVLL
jgi:hypothetical protein